MLNNYSPDPNLDQEREEWLHALFGSQNCSQLPVNDETILVAGTYIIVPQFWYLIKIKVKT